MSEEEVKMDAEDTKKPDENTAKDNVNDRSSEVSEEIKNDSEPEPMEVSKRNTKDSETDLSNVKIRHVLAYRLKKCSCKQVIAFILVGIICFGAGMLTDRAFVRHGYRGQFYGKPQMRGNMLPRNFNKNRGNNQNNNSNSIPQNPSNGQPQN